MLPKQQDSLLSNTDSPQGLVPTISPSSGKGLYSLTVSIKMIPGSPFCHAPSTNLSHISLAGRVFVTSPLRGLISSKSLFAFTAFMNLSVTATEILKLLI